VVSDHFINDTAKFADLVLPATMQAEQLDIMVTWGHLYISLNSPAIEPPEECVPNSELFPSPGQDHGLRRRLLGPHRRRDVDRLS